MTYCLICSDTHVTSCPSCRGKGRLGGFLGLGARECPLCSGKREVPCPDCAVELGDVLGPQSEPALSQSSMGVITTSRPAMVPPAPTDPVEETGRPLDRKT